MTIRTTQTPDVVGVVLVSCGLSAAGRLASAMSGGPPPPCPTSLPSPPEHQIEKIQYDPPQSQSPGAPQPPAPRRKLENADSSYDSDFEPCEVTSTTAVATQDQEGPDDEEHEDVCRTVSDTLAAEFAEYVSVTLPSGQDRLQKGITTHTPNSAALTTVLPTTPPLKTHQPIQGTKSTTAIPPAVSNPSTILSQVGKATLAHTVSLPKAPTICNVPPVLPTNTSIASPPPPPTLTLTEPPGGSGGETSSTIVVEPPEALEGAASCAWVCDRPGYAAQVEFGVKLGYSETLVQQALAKLGHQPPKDDLLSELIRLGAANQRPEGEADTSDEAVEVKDEGEAQQAAQQTSTTQQESQQQQQTQQNQHPQLQLQHSTLRSIVIDGSNVAMSHGNKSTFSCRGLRICVDWFRARGHTQITVFVPTWRKEAPRWDAPITDRELLLDLESEGFLVFTPSRVCGGKRIVMYDDRYILNEALQSQAIVVSNDNYRDLAAESRDYHRIIEENLLMYSWVNGRFVPPDDPLGRNGPTLDLFLRRVPSRDRGQATCPYGRKCTYGNKCKYNHPERGNAQIKSVTERLQEQAQRHYQDKAKSRDSSPGEGLRGKSLSLPVGVSELDITKKPLARTKSNVPGTTSLSIPPSRQLPSSLTQESSTSREKSSTTSSPSSAATTTTTASPHHPQLLHPQLDPRPLNDPMRSNQIYKSDSSLYPLYASPSLPGGYGALGWKQPGPGQSGASPSHGFSTTHMPLSKQLSDPPDPQVMADNPHPRLQRQLTLNPAFDSRLYKIQGFREPAPELFRFAGQPPQQPMQQTSQQNQHQPQQHQPQQQAPGSGSPSRSMASRGDSGNISGGRASPGFSSSPYGSREHLAVGLHPPLTRHSSSQEGTNKMSSLPLHLYPFNPHPQVSRFASAPDPIWGGQQQATPSPPQITRLNSTSDTHLNVYGSCSDSTQFLSDVFEDVCHLPPSFPSGSSAPMHGVAQAQGNQSAIPSPGPIGSRPMSPKQGAQVLHHSPVVSPRLPQIQSQHTGLTSSSSFSNLLTSAASHEDARLRVFYHLSNLFPEAQVRSVLAQYPNETDPQKICSYIVNPSGQQVGSRPMSPQQQPPLPTPSVATHQGLALRGSSPITAGFASSLPTGHEDARLRAFYHLSKLFPEAEVRAVLARYPEETDVKQFCATLLGYGTGPS